MKISLVTQNTNLVAYLSVNPSLTVENAYTDLTSEYEKFINELNLVDVFLLVDYENLTPSLAMLTKAIRSGSSYLFKPKELVIVTYRDPALSPTDNSSDKYMAFNEMLQEKNLTMRLVHMEIIDFPSIYKAILRDTDWEDDDLTTFTKYKVKRNAGGVILKPKRRKASLEPKTNLETRETLVKQDQHTKDGAEGVNITIPERSADVKHYNVSVNDLPKPRNSPELIVITGTKYSGKTTTCIRILNYFEKNGKPGLAVDTTGRRDLQRLLATEDASFPVLKGRALFDPVDSQVLGIQTFKPIYTAHFLDTIKNIGGASTPIFVEVDFPNVKSFLDTFQGHVTVIVIIEYEFTKLRDTSLFLENDYPVNIVLNSRSGTKFTDDEWIDIDEVVREYIHNVIEIYTLDDMSFVDEIMGVIK